MKIKEIWFDADYIWGRDEAGKEYKQLATLDTKAMTAYTPSLLRLCRK